VGLGPSPVVRLEGALAHDDSATARGQRMRAAATSAPTQSFPGYTAVGERNREQLGREENRTSATELQAPSDWSRERARTYPVENLDGSLQRC
jgi:hypothetical protein